MEITRNKYLNELKQRMHNGLVKVITGMRRSGKSYLMNEIFYRYLLNSGVPQNHIIRFAFDSANDLALIGEDLLDIDSQKRKVDPHKFMSYITTRIIDDNQYYLLLDEVQNLGSFESVLNGYLRKQNLDIYVTGSNSKFLSSDVITEFEGRGDEIHIFPLSFTEFRQVYLGNEDKAFDEYSLYGGLPMLCLMSTDQQKVNYLETQTQNIYLKDVVVRHNLRSDTNVDELFDILASGISSLTSPTKLTATFNSKENAHISRQTISNYIQYFMESFLISKALRYDVKGKSYIDSPFKIYFEDVGVRNARLGFRQTEPTHLMENIIYNELRYRGFRVDVGVVEARGTRDGKTVRDNYEIDFVANLGSQRYYIQSVYDLPDEEKWEHETKAFNKLDDSFKKILIVRKPIVSRYSEKGYLMMSLFDFLLDENSLTR